MRALKTDLCSVGFLNNILSRIPSLYANKLVNSAEGDDCSHRFLCGGEGAEDGLLSISAARAGAGLCLLINTGANSCLLGPDGAQVVGESVFSGNS